MSFGAGACLNPALGMAQSTYAVGLTSTFDPSCIWVYMTMPFVGAFLATLFFGIHKQMKE